jgi:hypothetical protein
MLGALCRIAERRGCAIAPPLSAITSKKGKKVDSEIQEALEVCQTAIANSLYRFEQLAGLTLLDLSRRDVRPIVAYRELQLAVEDFEIEELSYLRAYRARVSEILAEDGE